MTAIRVAHAGADYDVLVGDLAEAMPPLEELADRRHLPIISDRRVFDLHGRLLAGVALLDPILVPEGEAAKEWRTLAEVIDRLAGLKVKRGTPIIALGGGSVGDVAGLAASVFKRGCPIIHVPTTLLAQADSAIGGKTAIDAAGQKNLVGTFHHPSLVIADPALLDTLDDRQLRSGYAEVVKYGLIDNPAFFEWCEANCAGLLHGNREIRQAAIDYCVRTKTRFITADPDDTAGQRALLNFGHTFGHAIEAVAGHSVLHGEAIAVGMALAFGLSAVIGHCPTRDVDRLVAHLKAAGLPASLEDLSLSARAASVFEAMQSDKKSGRRGLALILTKGIGKAFVTRDVEQQQLRAFLA